MITGESIGSKYGESISNFSQVAENTATDILRIWCNSGIDLMRKKIYKKARTKGASTLAASIVLGEPEISATSISIGIKATKDAPYWNYVDKGVQKSPKLRGGKLNPATNKAPNSPFKFKNLGVPDAMVKSFKEYIARTGTKSYKVGGKRKSLYKTNRKTKEKTFRTERADEAAKSLAVATKIGGIKPMNYISEANNNKRRKELIRALKTGLGSAIKSNIKLQLNEYNNK